jgi:hypothetical protein
MTTRNLSLNHSLSYLSVILSHSLISKSSILTSITTYLKPSTTLGLGIETTETMVNVNLEMTMTSTSLDTELTLYPDFLFLTYLKFGMTRLSI